MACQGSCGLWRWVAMPPPSTWPWRTFLGICSGDLAWESWNELVQENAKVMWTHMGSRLLTMFIPNACLNIYQKILAGSFGSQLFCTGGLLLSGDLWIIKMLQCFPGFWFVAATLVNVHGAFGARFRSPAQGRAGGGANPVSWVAALIALRLERWLGMKWVDKRSKSINIPPKFEAFLHFFPHPNLLQKSPAVVFWPLGCWYHLPELPWSVKVRPKVQSPAPDPQPSGDSTSCCRQS